MSFFRRRPSPPRRVCLRIDGKDHWLFVGDTLAFDVHGKFEGSNWHIEARREPVKIEIAGMGF